MKLVTITNHKGGCGKSTTALHLADYLSTRGHKILLIDSDPNRSCIEWAKRGSLSFPVLDEKSALKQISKYEWVILDTPARPGSNDIKELSAGCDLMIIPSSPDVVSLAPSLELLSEIGSCPYRLLLVMIPPKPNREGAILQAELKESGIPVFNSMIRRSVAFQKAAFSGCSVRELKGRDRTPWRDYQALGGEIDV